MKKEVYLLLLTFCQRLKAAANIIYKNIKFFKAVPIKYLVAFLSFGNRDKSSPSLSEFFLPVEHVFAQGCAATKICHFKKSDVVSLLRFCVVLCYVRQTV